MQRRTAVLTALALALAACGTTQGAAKSQSASPNSTSAASPSPSAVLIVVAEEPSTGYLTGPTTVRLMRPDGKEVDRLTVKQKSRVARAAGGRIFVLGEDGSLKAIHRDGSVEDLGSLGTSPPSGFVVSPDGKRWLWSTYDANGLSQVHLAGDGGAARVVAQSQSMDTSVRAYSWTTGGAFISHQPNGIGGYILFDGPFGPVDRLDPTTYTTAPIQTGNCLFSDMAADGTVACFPAGSDQNSRAISIIKKDGTLKTLQLAMPRFSQEGDAYFSRDGRVLSVGGAANAGTYGQPEQFGTDVITTRDGSITRLAIDGVRPSDQMQGQAWLDDGSLVVFRPEGAAGGSAGVFLVGPSGKVTQLGGRGTPIGLISG
jgi:hypothetical protein